MAVQTSMRSLYNILWGECSKLMQNKLRANKDFEDIKEDGYLVRILLAIRGISIQREAGSLIYDSLGETRRKFYTYQQQPH